MDISRARLQKLRKYGVFLTEGWMGQVVYRYMFHMLDLLNRGLFAFLLALDRVVLHVVEMCGVDDRSMEWLF